MCILFFLQLIYIIAQFLKVQFLEIFKYDFMIRVY